METAQTLQNHAERIGELETRTARHEERIKDLEDQDRKIYRSLERIEDKLDRPSWGVSVLITALFSLVTGLLVYIASL